MPNHITNKLEIKGDIATINKIIGNEGQEFSFEIVVPMPKEEENNWYDWHCENWGTKWDAYDVSEITRENNFVRLIFQTAWSPPQAWLGTVMQKYPELEYVLYWSDEDFPSSGKITNNADEYYDHKNPYALKFLKKHFSDFYNYVIDDYVIYCNEHNIKHNIVNSDEEADEEADEESNNKIIDNIELKTDNITL